MGEGWSGRLHLDRAWWDKDEEVGEAMVEQARNGPGIVEGVPGLDRGRGLGGWSHCRKLGLTSLRCTGQAILLKSQRV